MHFESLVSYLPKMHEGGTDLRLGPFWYTGPMSRSSSVTAQGKLARMGRSLYIHDKVQRSQAASRRPNSQKLRFCNATLAITTFISAPTFEEKSVVPGEEF